MRVRKVATMAAERQEMLRAAWLGGVHGHLSAMSEARAWALREVYLEMGRPKWGLNTFVASRVTKVGGGAPGVSAVGKSFARLRTLPKQCPDSAQTVPITVPNTVPIGKTR